MDGGGCNLHSKLIVEGRQMIECRKCSVKNHAVGLVMDGDVGYLRG